MIDSLLLVQLCSRALPITNLGSANINDRSLLGDRDSEIGAIIDSASFARSLRIRIWAVALGDPEQSLETSFPPESREFFDYWKNRAKFNFQVTQKHKTELNFFLAFRRCLLRSSEQYRL